MKSPQFSGKPRKRRLIVPFILRQVKGDSMVPTLKAGQLVVGRQKRELSVGDVVIASHNGIEKIKRIEKQQGDRIYLLGDNRSASTDSRNFGWLPLETVVAKVVWPKL